MSKVARHLLVCTRAETKAEALFNRALDRLHQYNQRLVDLSNQIAKSQPQMSGAVGLALYSCSQAGCRGCPHARWEQYFWKPSRTRKQTTDQLSTINLSKKKQDPVKKLKPTTEGYEKTKALIQEAKFILKMRSKLVASFRQLEYAMGRTQMGA